VVLSCTDIHTDGARNAIPSHVTITGDTRSFEPESQQLIERRISELAHGVTSAYGASAKVTYTHEFATTVNDPGCVGVAARAAGLALGENLVDSNCEPIMASEDFGILAQHVPACLALLGNGTAPDEGGTPLHSHDYRFNDNILASGIAFYRQVIIEALGSDEPPRQVRRLRSLGRMESCQGLPRGGTRLS
jgi:hippurate hydrolase